jgi:hypothetical protein
MFLWTDEKWKALRHSAHSRNNSVTPTGAKRSGGTLCLQRTFIVDPSVFNVPLTSGTRPWTRQNY